MKKQLWLLLLCTLVLTLSACVMLPPAGTTTGTTTDTAADTTTDTAADTTADTAADTIVDDATMVGTGTIVDIAAGNENFSTLVTALTETGLVDLFADPDAEWTVFAPTNDAFAALPEGVLNTVLTDKELLTRILTYHVMQGVVTSDMISTMMAPTMEMNSVGGDLMGSQLDIKYYANGNITINEANIVMANVLASNGVIHAIDTVLLPPDIESMMYLFASVSTEEVPAEASPTEEPPTQETVIIDNTMSGSGTIVDIATSNENFSAFTTAVIAAGLSDLLAAPGAEWTVFAPTNNAFAAQPEGVLDTIVADKELLTRILTYHVLEGAVTFNMVSTMMAPSMEMSSVGGPLMGSQLDMKIGDNGGVTVNDANIIIADVRATNGIIHAINTLLLPPDIAAMFASEEAAAAEVAGVEVAGEAAAAADNTAMGEMGTIVDIAADNESFATLVTAVTEAGLVDLLAASNAEWTVFAPTNDAFAALPEGVLDMALADKELLTRILTYHVMEGVVTSDMVSTMMAPTMEMGSVGGELTGSQLDIKYYANGNITINEANIVIADVLANNGVIHAVDAVLLPPDVAALIK